MIRYGKQLGQLIKIKKSFFEENDLKIKESLYFARRYSSQRRRVLCKNCMFKLDEICFEKFGVGYAICLRCGHLNGIYEDSEDFVKNLYYEDGGRDYARTYIEKDNEAYNLRIDEIYLPKALFLIEVLECINENPSQFSYVDIGAGSGYFVAALLKVGMKNVKGYEVSSYQVKIANAMLKKDIVKHHKLHEIDMIVSNLKAEVVSLIGVLEHLQHPRRLLKSLRDNPFIRYIYFSVPLFSPCIFFEQIFHEVTPRQLTGGHTHLYTESSISYFCNELKFEKVAEWWFGSDMLDLYRSVSVMLEKSSNNRFLVNLWSKVFEPLIDDMQLAIDKKKASSEVHMIVRIKK